MADQLEEAWQKMSLLEKSDALCVAAENARLAGNTFASLALAAKAAQYTQLHRILNQTPMPPLKEETAGKGEQ